MKYILSLLLILICKSLCSQDIEGKYFGTFLDPENIISFELINGRYTATIITSSKTSFVLDCKQFGEVLLFNMPLNDDSELEVKAILKNEDLELSFSLKGKSYTTILNRIGIQTIPEVNKKEKEKLFLDPKIIGKWILLGSYFPSGEIADPSSFKKNYYKVFTKDGRIVIDSRMFRDALSKDGLSSTFSYSDIPDFNWRVKPDKILVTSSPGLSSFEEEYFFQGDSLIFTTDRGIKKYYIRDKKE
jgi:hypothetical protein